MDAELEGVPATDELRERLAKALHEAQCGCPTWVVKDLEDTQYDDMAAAILPLLAAVVAEARTEALSEVAEILSKPGVIWHGDGGVTVRTDPTWREPDVPLVDWIRQRVAAIREGGNQNAEPKCICDGGAYGVVEHPFILNAGCRIHGRHPYRADQKGTE